MKLVVEPKEWWKEFWFVFKSNAQFFSYTLRKRLAVGMGKSKHEAGNKQQ